MSVGDLVFNGDVPGDFRMGDSAMAFDDGGASDWSYSDLTSLEDPSTYTAPDVSSDTNLLPDPPTLDYNAPDLTDLSNSGVLAANGAYEPYQQTQEATAYTQQNGQNVLSSPGYNYNRSVYGMESDYGPAEPGPRVTLSDPPSSRSGSAGSGGGSGMGSSAGNMSKNPATPPKLPIKVSLPKVTLGGSGGPPTVITKAPGGLPSQTYPPQNAGVLGGGSTSAVFIGAAVAAGLVYLFVRR